MDKNNNACYGIFETNAENVAGRNAISVNHPLSIHFAAVTSSSGRPKVEYSTGEYLYALNTTSDIFSFATCKPGPETRKDLKRNVQK